MQANKVVRVSGNVRIDPSLIPPADYDLACAVLDASIRHALSDPDTKAEYEAWLIKYREQHTAGGGEWCES